MKNKFLTASLLLSLTAAAACSGDAGHGTASHNKAVQNAAPKAPAAPEQAKAGHDAGHSHGAEGSNETPAFITDAAQLKELKPTLPPERFQGMQRLGYIAAREIPQTLAQLPCYCHCDKGFGHKSLQSCFVDDHAAHCAVCIEEALLALRLQKQEGMSPEQVRQRIIAEYGSRH
ncbi:MAG TPA: CYCXC family (seleno)protein [Pyrinomonadaceae bacterium]|jgi:hypothetical protein|nr:CYCXC family (seleno)protein [Pyrinomonadaceae bacterium]